jgi:putative flippase GtrA
MLNTTFGYAAYAAFIWLGLNYFFALAFATILGILFNFKTIGSLVFKSKSMSKIYKFSFIYLFLFLINILLIKALLLYGLNSYLAGGLTVLPLAMASFLLNKYFVFKE